MKCLRTLVLSINAQSLIKGHGERSKLSLLARIFSKDVQSSSPPPKLYIPQAVGGQPQQQACGRRSTACSVNSERETGGTCKLIWLFTNTCILFGSLFSPFSGVLGSLTLAFFVMFFLL